MKGTILYYARRREAAPAALVTVVRAQTPADPNGLRLFGTIGNAADHETATLCDGSEKGPGVRPPGRVADPKPLYPMAIKKAKKANLPSQ